MRGKGRKTKPCAQGKKNTVHIRAWLRKKTEFLKRSASKRLKKPSGSPLGMSQSCKHQPPAAGSTHRPPVSKGAIYKHQSIYVTGRDLYNIQIMFGLREEKKVHKCN